MIYSLEKILILFFVAVSWFLFCTKPKSLSDSDSSVACYTAEMDSTSKDQSFSMWLAEEANDVPEEIKIISYWLGTR